MSEKISAVKVNQWLPEWNEVNFSESEHRRKPLPYFYVFSISAKKLRRLAAVYRRDTTIRAGGAEDLGVQRQHDPRRSDEIKRFVQWGYPWSTMSLAQREQPDFKGLRKPGWLPTAIVVNILSKDDSRNEKRVAECDLVKIDENDNKIIIPGGVNDDWKPQSISPIEVIDGQHRLWAFDGLSEDIELPVVAFYGLDISWQAYLFWSINIMPKKINPSLAYDLYPLLRAQDWLEGFAGPAVYREARSQEIVEIIWSDEGSPWYHRINMLGDRGVKAQVSQAAWIRALLSSYVKAWKDPVRMLGGFYGVLADGDKVVPWTLNQQAMFLMYLGNRLKSVVTASEKPSWVLQIEEGSLPGVLNNVAFESEYCMLNHDQGIRGLLDVTNNVFCALYNDLNEEYLAIGEIDVKDYSAYETNLKDVAPQLCMIVDEIVALLVQFDWRSYDFPGLSEDDRRKKAGFRGSGGYKLIRDDLMSVLTRTTNTALGNAVSRVRDAYVR